MFFLEEKVLVLPTANNLNHYVIKLEKSQQLSYAPIYSLSLVELKMLKISIKTNLDNNFIWPLKLPTNISIIFV